MKVLIVGEFSWPWYQEACARALEVLGCKVIRFGWLERFKKARLGKTEPVFRSFWKRLEYRLLDGPTVRKLNKDLTELAVCEMPDVVWFYNVQHIRPETVRGLRARLPGAVFCQYANDNPFSFRANKDMWRYFIASIPYFDVHHAYRTDNIQDLMAHGAKNVFLLRAYFIPYADRNIDFRNIPLKYHCDVVFAGHFENDGRVEALEAVCRAGYKLNVFGGGWAAAWPGLAPDSPLRALYPIQPVTGQDYNYAICGAKVSLCFLSTLNKDTYTRRCFQIPAMKAAMLAQRTDDLAGLFCEGEEAAFFSNTDELLTRLRLLVTDDDLRRRIAEGGYARVVRDGHDVTSRMRQWLGAVQAFRDQAGRAV